MKRNWTEKQLDAIGSTGGSVLVSAAAGSGKTAVLVERVIRRLTDPVNPTDANRLLIVTFTRAAAGEMRQRIAAAIEELLKENPNDKNLINQQMLLPSAKICTIDSFCNSLVRENFQFLDISPDFKNADESELSLLKAQAMSDTLEELYERGEPDYLRLVELLFKGRDDSNLSDMIYKLYLDSMSYPFPEKWLDSLSEKYESGKSVCESSYGKLIMSYARQAVVFCLEAIDSMKKTMCGIDGLESAFLSAVESDEAQIRYVLEKLDSNDWDGVCSAVSHFDAVRRGRTPKEYKDSFEEIRLSKTRDLIKQIMKKDLPSYFCCSESEYVSDMMYLAPLVRQLVCAVKLFSEKFTGIKTEKNIADFSDVAHMALSLLLKEDENGDIVQTDFALSEAQNYDEILIDEYQDTNKAQDMLFEALSRDNLFRVGDVKQSIYRFRRAMPEIFIELKDRFSEYDRTKDEYPAKIILGNNFRSRKGVTDAVNFIFSQVMSRQVGGIDYNDEEKLVFSANYKLKADDYSEIHILDLSETDSEEESSDSVQARYIASMIKKMIADGFTVRDGDGERKASYKDFCVLLRSVNGGRGANYADAFRQSGVPCFTETSAGFFSSNEVSLVLNLLRVIDNPKQDIPLLSVMMSVLYGFTVDETAKLRIDERKGDLYTCLVNAADGGDEKARYFLGEIARLRMLCVSMGVEDFIRQVYDETALPQIVSAMPEPQAKKANLMLLLDYASTYEKTGYIGLSGFIGFIDRLDRNRQDLQGSVGVSADADVVKIMSIHKSKGLEFPVCIIANCFSRFNRQDEINNMVVSPAEGIGLVLRDSETLAEYPTVSHKAVKLSIKNDTVSEEMRVLYVAMTRAAEKLIMVGSLKNPESTLSRYAININPDSRKITPFASSMASGFGEWILTAALRNESCENLRDIAGIGNEAVLHSDAILRSFVVKPEKVQAEEAESETAVSVDPKLLKLIHDRCEYRYEYEPLSLAVSKRSASQVDKNFIDREYFASSRPAFLSEDGLTAAQRGTATHSFMQYADYDKAKVSVKDEIRRLVENGIIAENEGRAINVRAVEKFFESDLYKRISESQLVMREKKFTVSVPAYEIYPELATFPEEEVLIQGIADCVFLENGKLTVVDYKTDSLDTEEEFIEKYRSQVMTYRRALSLCTGYEVGKTLLYSFRLAREIAVDGEE
ncbi:MAG: helicase-exonuclease AddAB subunit AddA [Acutalibacteraceae bacterium]